MIEPVVITPDWPAPECVGSAITTRMGGQSTGAYQALNLALHVGDDASRVTNNRQALRQALQLPQEPQWLEQIHGVKVVAAQEDNRVRTADAAVTDKIGLACAVLTADCLPILLCDQQGLQVGAVHAGWRGLAKGIVRRAIARFSLPPTELMAYLGPAISLQHFEVGIDVPQMFFRYADSADQADAIAAAIRPGARPMHFYADIYALARAALVTAGVRDIYGGDYCTYADEQRFYSYRRDGVTGRVASLIWRK